MSGIRRAIVAAALGLSWAIASLPGCSPVGSSATGSEPGDGASGQMKAELVVTRSGARLARVSRASAAAQPAEAEADQLRWEFHDADGKLAAKGMVADPRVARAEFGEDENGEGDGATFLGNMGSLDLGLPAVDGDLVIFEPDGDGWQQLGTVPIAVPVDDGDNDLVDLTKDLVGQPTKVVDHGPTKGRLNILVVPDGYTQAQLGSFHEDVVKMTNALKAVPGYAEHWNQINVWVQDIRSPSSGIDDPKLPQAKKTTAFEMSFGNDVTAPRRCVMPDTNVQSYMVAALNWLRARVQADAVVIMANTAEYGGCAQPWNNFVTVTRNTSSARIVAHELGHSVFKLNDEYDGGGVSCQPSRWTTGGVNVSSDVQHLPWSDLVNAHSLPSGSTEPATAVGAFEGAGYCTKSVYRPQKSCMMRTLSANLCAVCSRQFDRFFAQRAAQP